MNHHEASHLTATGSRPLKIALAIVLAVMVVEVIGGIISGSLALLGDAGHMLVDALALGLALFALTIARRPATPTRTYGYHRVEIMAALANGTILILVSIYIFYEAYQRAWQGDALPLSHFRLISWCRGGDLNSHEFFTH